MLGLLYTNYISTCRNQKINYLYLIPVLSVVLMILIILSHFSSLNTMYCLKNDNGEVIYLSEFLHATFFCCLMIISYGELFNKITQKIILDDDKKLIKSYIDTMPLKKNSYVASKYMYAGLFCCFVSVILFVSGLISKKFYSDGLAKECLTFSLSFVPLFAAVSFLVSSIELPLFMPFGNERALLIKLSLISIVALFVIGFFMFGDLSILDNFNILSLMEWLKSQKKEYTTFKIAAPLVSVALFYLSFKISCVISEKAGN